MDELFIIFLIWSIGLAAFCFIMWLIGAIVFMGAKIEHGMTSLFQGLYDKRRKAIMKRRGIEE
jgi:hypothetical protein